ncbi:MAG: metallophosphoesterase family protein [Desulfotomaculaceae bacterium]|nr:metallophosphoesterase family protein [Desulfotomaculaceae bacterium]
MKNTTIGLIADTHNLLRPEVLSHFSNVDLIIHARDIGSPDILAQLSQLATVIVVRDNVDKGKWADSLPLTEFFEWQSKFIYVIHDLGGAQS